MGSSVGSVSSSYGFEGGEVEAAEETLGAVGAGLRVLLGRDVGVAGVEVFGEDGEGFAPLFELGCEGLGGAAGGFGEDAGLGLEAVEGHVFAGAEGGEGYGGEVGGVGYDGVEGELRLRRGGR